MAGMTKKEILKIIQEEPFGRGSFERDEYKSKIIEKIVLHEEQDISTTDDLKYMVGLSGRWGKEWFDKETWDRIEVIKNKLKMVVSSNANRDDFKFDASGHT